MSVEKRGNVYWMYFTFNGNRIQRSTKCTNKRDAEAIEAAYRTQLAKGEVGITPKKQVPSFIAALNEFSTWYQSQHSKPNSIASHKSTIKVLLEFFDNHAKIDSFNSSHIEKFKLWRRQRRDARGKEKRNVVKNKTQIAGASVNRDLACLKTFFNYWIKAEIITRNPVTAVKFLPENLNRWKVISEDTERLYLMAASEPLQSIATLMIETGARPAELFHLERKNVNLIDRSIFIPIGKTKKARRPIPLSERAFNVLTRHLREYDGNYVFTNEATGKPFGTLKKAHASAIRRSGVEQFRLYDLRHTFASRMAMAGVDIVTLKDLLGHSSLEMTMKYAHGDKENRISAIQKMEEFRMQTITGKKVG